MLPNFIIVGAAKCGTTSVDKYLRQHPEIYMCPQKEPYFFSFIGQKIDFKGPFDQIMKEIIVTDFERYKSYFNDVTEEKAVGECSNSYLFFPHTANEIKKYIPDCKIIIILRDPVERAFSHYSQHVMIGHENLSFEEAINAEEERKQAGWRWHYQYLAQSMYYKQVKRYFDIFPKENILVTFFDDLKENPEDFMLNIFRFLNVRQSVETINFKVYNKTGLPRNRQLFNMINDRKETFLRRILQTVTSENMRAKIVHYINKLNIDYNAKPKLSEKTRQQLKDFFREDVEKLEILLNKDLSAWK